MCAEVLDNKDIDERWNLSDDDDYVDINMVEDEYRLIIIFYR